MVLGFIRCLQLHLYVITSLTQLFSLTLCLKIFNMVLLLILFLRLDMGQNNNCIECNKLVKPRKHLSLVTAHRIGGNPER